MNDERIELRISTREKLGVENTARTLGLSASELIRRAIANAVRSAERNDLSVLAPRPPVPAIQSGKYHPPDPKIGEHPVDLESRLESWWPQQSDPAGARDAAHRALEKYRLEWPEIWRKLYGPKNS
jgi:hypothetical protein